MSFQWLLAVGTVVAYHLWAAEGELGKYLLKLLAIVGRKKSQGAGVGSEEAGLIGHAHLAG